MVGLVEVMARGMADACRTSKGSWSSGFDIYICIYIS